MRSVGIGTDGGISQVIVDDQFRDEFRTFVRDRKAKGIAAPGEDEDVYMFVATLNTPHKLETLAEQLSARGHRDARIAKILGGNFARVFAETWRGARPRREPCARGSRTAAVGDAPDPCVGALVRVR